MWIVALDPIFSFQPYLCALNCGDRPTDLISNNALYFELTINSSSIRLMLCSFLSCKFYLLPFLCPMFLVSTWTTICTNQIDLISHTISKCDYSSMFAIILSSREFVPLQRKASCNDSFFIFHWLAWYNAWILSLYFFDFLSIFCVFFYFIRFLERRRRSEFFLIKIYLYIVQLIFSIVLRNVWLKSMNPTVGCYYVPHSPSLSFHLSPSFLMWFRFSKPFNDELSGK